jgi:hypothetical protein
MPTDKAALTRVNAAIEKMTINKYKAFIPCNALFELLAKEGFEPADPDEMPSLLGSQGRAIFEFFHPSFPEREYILHLSWYKMESGNYEIVARFEGIKTKKGKLPPTRPMFSPDRTFVAEVNSAINEITVNRYERVVPFQSLFLLMDRAGFEPTENSSENTHGNEGRMTAEFIHRDYSQRRYYLHISWYRMPSTNYETVARLESSGRR